MRLSVHGEEARPLRAPAATVAGRARMLVAASVILAAASIAAHADPVEDFYRGKRITLTIGSSAGGGTDLYGRLVARFIGNHIPGHPAVQPVNVPGAVGLVSVNQLYNTAPRDGTALATFDRYLVYQAIWDNPQARFDPSRINWIGSTNVDVSTCVTWAASGIATLNDFMTREIVLGATTDSHANILTNIFGAKLKAVKGYPGGNDVTLALERGEVQGRCNWSWSSIMSTRPDWVRDHKINIIVQFSRRKLAELPDVPLVSELARTDTQRQILDLILASQMMARPFAAPPGLPADRVAALRDAFDAAMHDPELAAAARQGGLPLEPVAGREIQDLVTQKAATPKDVIRMFHQALTTGD
jgi:tripartite-type tricarboxylate transporter receptor subunit TctC